MTTNQITPIVFPNKIVPSVPDTGDVIIFGCKHSDYVEARVIIFPAQALIFPTQSPFIQCVNNGE